ncbi:O-antigen ligase family protein [Rhizobium sp. Root1204]|uniref:O-antigen ligase family protein n=1 Tax=Rhizobium sp. Root1204 TaxID=1736428 RepID=UPI000713BC18|nr:O-antigen ligase family protein [Rhizobium sp. Root1204]KQV38687.1 hypothetical protein ASC96_25480 [Rhizobium sp. Root1204]
MTDIPNDLDQEWREKTYSAEMRRSKIIMFFDYPLVVGGVFLCSMVYIRPTAGNITFSDIMFAAALVVLLLSGRISFYPFGRMSAAVWLVGLSTLLAGLTISSMKSPDPMRAMAVVAQYAYAYLAIMLIFSSQSAKNIVTFAKVYVLSISVICLHGVYLIHYDGQRDTVFVTGSGRLTGLMERTNECATVIALCVPIVLVLCTTGHMRKTTGFLAVAIMTYGILLTGSNSGLMSLVCGVGIFALLGLSWKRMLLPLAIGVTILALSGGLVTEYLPATFQKRVLGALETGDLGKAGSFDGRVELINEALEMTSDTIFIGVGADQYRVGSQYHAPVHNVYLLLWIEGGLISAIGFLVMVLGGLGPAISVLKVPGGRPFAAAILANVTVFLLAANALPHIYSRFWVLPVLLPIFLASTFADKERGLLRGRADTDRAPSPLGALG